MDAKNLKVSEAAKKMGKTAMFVRMGLRKGAFPFGTAVFIRKKWSYYINKAKFNEYVG